MQLKKHGIHQLIVIGLIAHTCVEATVRYAFELGYEVTMVRDATADYSEVEMNAALDVNIPNYASAIVKTDEVVHLTLFSKCRVQNERLFRIQNFAARRQLPGLRHSIRGFGRRFLEVARHSSKLA